MKVVVISIGQELLAGQILDTNATWLAAELGRLGTAVIRHLTVGDEILPLARAIRDALGESDVVVTTGGLGPTPDDLTREALSSALSRPLELNHEALAGIEALFERWGRSMHPANRLQAMIPAGCEAIPNDHGTAPGIAFHSEGKHVFALPGVPGEMKLMFAAAVVPVLRADGGGVAIASHKIVCFGVTEARVGELLADLMVRGRNPLVGTTASDAVIAIRVTASGTDAADAARLAEADATEIRRRIGPAVIGDGDTTLENEVGRLLTQHRMSIATAESCTGGLVAKRLTDVPGSSAYFKQAYVTYADEAKIDLLGVSAEVLKQEGAVSGAIAAAMAEKCRAAAATDFALATTGIAGPTGGNPPDKPVGLVYVALASAGGVQVKRLQLGEHLSRCQIRDRACKAALNLLRLTLLGIESSA